jgi:hypothetical protein
MVMMVLTMVRKAASSIRPGKAEEASTPSIGETAKMQGPSRTFALWGTWAGAGARCSYYLATTRIMQRRTLRCFIHPGGGSHGFRRRYGNEIL